VLDYYLENETEVSLMVFDIQGRMVRELGSGQSQKGRQSTIWDGTDNSGAQLSSGLYLIYLKAGDKISTQKVMLNR
jgi:flagellar hook assembly protein FlgD